MNSFQTTHKSHIIAGGICGTDGTSSSLSGVQIQECCVGGIWINCYTEKEAQASKSGGIIGNLFSNTTQIANCIVQLYEAVYEYADDYLTKLPSKVFVNATNHDIFTPSTNYSSSKIVGNLYDASFSNDSLTQITIKNTSCLKSFDGNSSRGVLWSYDYERNILAYEKGIEYSTCSYTSGSYTSSYYIMYLTDIQKSIYNNHHWCCLVYNDLPSKKGTSYGRVKRLVRSGSDQQMGRIHSMFDTGEFVADVYKFESKRFNDDLTGLIDHAEALSSSSVFMKIDQDYYIDNIIIEKNHPTFKQSTSVVKEIENEYYKTSNSTLEVLERKIKSTSTTLLDA